MSIYILSPMFVRNIFRPDKYLSNQDRDARSNACSVLCCNLILTKIEMCRKFLIIKSLQYEINKH
jgi:hypothetical protein